MLPDGILRERVIQRGQDGVLGFSRQFYWVERVLEEGQALRALQCDSAGAEPTIVMIFGRMNLSSMHAAPKEDG